MTAGPIDFLPILEAWFGNEIARLYSTAPDRREGLLMGCPVWGEEYVYRFTQYCLPTLTSAHNMAALRGRCRIVLYTDTLSFANLWANTRWVERQGIDLQLILIEPRVMEQAKAHAFNKYWILGVVHNVLVQMAGRAGMAFHMLLPDHLYAHRYFPSLFNLALKYEGVAQTGISADVVTAAGEIETYRQEDSSLLIPDRDLGDLGLRHLHKQTLASLMNNATIPDDLPHSHFLAWRGRDKLHLYCCHMNAAYLSPAMCAKAPHRIPATIDAELPSFMPKDFYVPKASDGMTFIEVSDDTKEHNERNVSLKDFAMRCWSQVRFQDDWMPYFKQVCEVPIHPQNKFVDDETIVAQHAAILKMLEAAKPVLAYEFIGNLAYNR